MNTSILIRHWRDAAIVLSVVLISGCAHIDHRTTSTHHRSTIDRQDTRISSECRRSQRSCNYNGQYEPGERNFAEQEARRLNQAQLDRLRRGAIW